MPLPAIREKFGAISTRRKILFLFFGILVIALLIITIELVYCLNSEACLFGVTRSFPQLMKITGVQETDLSYRRGNYSFSKQIGNLTVSGEIVGVEKNRLIIGLEDGSREAFSVAEGTEFVFIKRTDVVWEDLSEHEIYTFDGENLKEILLPGDYLAIAKVDGSTIYSKTVEEGTEVSTPIAVNREGKDEF